MKNKWDVQVLPVSLTVLHVSFCYYCKNVIVQLCIGIRKEIQLNLIAPLPKCCISQTPYKMVLFSLEILSLDANLLWYILSWKQWNYPICNAISYYSVGLLVGLLVGFKYLCSMTMMAATHFSHVRTGVMKG